MITEPDINIGDKVYYEFAPGFIVETYVKEIDDYVSISDDCKFFMCWYESEQIANSYCDLINSHNPKTSFYVIRYDARYYVAVPENVSLSDLYGNATTCSRFYWIDEPVGHAVDCEEISLTLNEAYVNASIAPKRKRNNPHKKYKTMWYRRWKGILSSHKAAGCNNPECQCKVFTLTCPERNIYIKRK